MIAKATEILHQELEAFMKSRTGFSTDIVKLVDLKEEGSVITDGQVSMTVINIEEERGHKTQSPIRINPNGSSTKAHPDIKLNVYFLFGSFNSANYLESLKRISELILFFQGKNVFTTENTPGLDPSIERLILDMHNLTTEQQNDLWGKLGMNYRPSVCYRMRMLIINDEVALEQRPLIENIGLDVNTKQ